MPAADGTEETPFAPRLRRRLLMRRILGGRNGVTAIGLPAWGLLAALLFSFWQLFRALDGVTPGGGGPLQQAQPALIWLLLTALFAALLGLALEKNVERRVGLDVRGLAELAREGWASLRAR